MPKNFWLSKKCPNLIPTKNVLIEWVDFNSKMKLAWCHWSWELGSIWHFSRKSGDKILAISYTGWIICLSTIFELSAELNIEISKILFYKHKLMVLSKLLEQNTFSEKSILHSVEPQTCKSSDSVWHSPIKLVIKQG